MRGASEWRVCASVSAVASGVQVWWSHVLVFFCFYASLERTWETDLNKKSTSTTWFPPTSSKNKTEEYALSDVPSLESLIQVQHTGKISSLDPPLGDFVFALHQERMNASRHPDWELSTPLSQPPRSVWSSARYTRQLCQAFQAAACTSRLCKMFGIKMLEMKTFLLMIRQILWSGKCDLSVKATHFRTYLNFPHKKEENKGGKWVSAIWNSHLWPFPKLFFFNPM